MVENLVILALQKSAEIILLLLVEKLWAWVLSDRNTKRLSNYLKMQILLLYLDWVLLKTPLKSLPDLKLALTVLPLKQVNLP
ncbi:MAG TPA: hypothetical protein DD379_02500 [Cyanobacteria bacterium UBA11162]|nr:hypothetical protein [Cyanobacteria bacterium UBA11162]